MERPTDVRNRLVALSAVLAFAVAVAAVAVVAGNGGDGDGRLEKLSFGAIAGAEGSTMALGEAAAYPDFGPVEYRVQGELADLGNEAPAYRLGDQATEAVVAKLASRLGLGGGVERNENGWTVRDDQRELSVLRAPGLPWYLSWPCGDPATTPTSSDPSGGVVSSGCAYEGVVVPDGGGPSSMEAVPAPPGRVATRAAPAAPPSPTSTAAPCRGGTVECAPATEAPTTSAPPPCPPGASCAYSEPQPFPGDPPNPPPPPPRPADLPTRAEAERLARSFFSDLGVGLDDFELRDGFVDWQAGVQSRIAGLPTIGWGHSVSVGPKGRITSASGFLAEPKRIGDYPLVTTARGLERLKSGEGVGPRPIGGGMEGGWTSTDVDCAKPTVICDPPPPVTTVPVEPQPPGAGGGCPPNAECFAPGSPPEPQPAPRAPPAPPPAPVPQVLTITGVHLALQQVGPALVPVYVFELEGGGEAFPVPAVTDQWIEADEQTRPEVPSDIDRPMPLAPPVPPPAPTTTTVLAPAQTQGVPAPRG